MKAISVFDELVDRHHFDTLGVIVEIARKRERGDDLWAEVSISDATQSGFIFRRRMNLNANTTLKRTAEEIGTRAPDIDWLALLEHAFWRSVDNWRLGEPLAELDSGGVPDPPGYLLEPYVSDTGVSILFGAGGSGKSIIALAMAMSLATGEPILGRQLEQRRVLYLDWEAERADHYFRFATIAEAYGIERPVAGLFYRREWASLTTIAEGIRSHIRDESIGLVIVDSLGGARGGAPESAEETIAAFTAMRSFGVPVLCVDHQSKANLSSPKQVDIPFGSVYTVNMARLIWGIKTVKQEGSSTFRAVLTNTKANNDRIHRRHSLEYVIDRDAGTTTFTTGDLLLIPPDDSSLKLYERLEIALRVGAATVAEICDEIEAPEANVRKVLNRYSDRFVNIGTSRKAVWALRANREELVE